MTTKTQTAEVLDKAFIAACEKLGLTQRHMPFLDEPQVDLNNTSTSGIQELALWNNKIKIIKVYKYLLALMSNEEAARLWVHSPNTAVAGIPAKLMQTQEGLVQVFNYLEHEANR